MRLHAVELSRPRIGLLPRGRVLEPQQVRYECGVAQQQQLGHLPRHNPWENGRQADLGQGEPQRPRGQSDQHSGYDLRPRVVLQVHAAIADEQGGEPTAADDEEAPEPLQERVLVERRQSDEDEQEDVGREEAHELRVVRRHSVLGVRVQAGHWPGLTYRVLEDLVQHFVQQLATEEGDLQVQGEWALLVVCCGHVGWLAYRVQVPAEEDEGDEACSDDQRSQTYPRKQLSNEIA